ncbi:hypothetical protein NDU88_000407 [Pleurodeles waltl]|uniref:Uncharacterized protein n=1 Tax=Pleurodeles waltl TaxID=8319 RepID=A0AAV7P0S6_PLEWA|nr:hypothetical protein NDU88_000407 [Pleurodeles waltl]
MRLKADTIREKISWKTKAHAVKRKWRRMRITGTVVRTQHSFLKIPFMLKQLRQQLQRYTAAEKVWSASAFLEEALSNIVRRQ